MKRITEYENIMSVSESDVLPIVDVSDTSQASTGSTKKGSIEKIADYVKNRTETLTNKTLTSPKINEDVVLTATSTELNKITGMLDWFYPVGTIYETTSSSLDTTAKMASHFGGTWEVYGAGRVIVGKNTSGTFNVAVGTTGGAETVQLVVDNYQFQVWRPVPGTGDQIATNFDAGSNIGIHTKYTSTNSNTAHDNLQPYIVVYRYRRTS